MARRAASMEAAVVLRAAARSNTMLVAKSCEGRLF
jgi:hypothetical protein